MSVHGKCTNLHFAKTVLKAADKVVFGVSACLVTPVAVADINADVETRVQSILQEMSLEQKVGQMVQGEIKWVSASDVTKYHLGSVLNGGGSFPGGKKNSSIDDWVNLADKYYKASMKTRLVFPLSGVQMRFTATTM